MVGRIRTYRLLTAPSETLLLTFTKKSLFIADVVAKPSSPGGESGESSHLKLAGHKVLLIPAAAASDSEGIPSRSVT